MHSILAASDFRGSYAEWKTSRELFNRFIRSGERVLDVGCANGFLLYSLLLWRDGSFVPYGFDINARRIAAARRRLAKFACNFWIHDMFNPWPRKMFDVVIAPWFDDHAYIAECVDHGATVLFSMYDDEENEHSMLPALCRGARLDVIGIASVPREIIVACVRGRTSGRRTRGFALASNRSSVCRH